MKKVLRSLGDFSHTSVISQHQTYRQSYHLILSPSTQSLDPSSTLRRTSGTTVSIKDLFSNYPVRLASSRANHQSEMTEITKISLGIILSRPIDLTLRTGDGDKILKIDQQKTINWEKRSLEKTLCCTLSQWTIFDYEHENVSLNVKICRADTSRNYTFCCTIPPDAYNRRQWSIRALAFPARRIKVLLLKSHRTQVTCL